MAVAAKDSPAGSGARDGAPPQAVTELSVIIVNWNSDDYLRECLASLYAQTSGVAMEVVVVDNASTRGDADSVRRVFPQIRLIRSAENLGFARANNLGVRESSGRYLLFLNPDTIVRGAAIATMLRQIESLPDAGIVGCKLLNTDLSVQTSCIQKFPTILNQALEADFLMLRFPACRLWSIDPLFAIGGAPAAVEVISGACLMIRRDVFEAVGGFAEDYFMYAEDVDLCYQVRQRGWKAYYVGQAEVVHHGGGSSRRTPRDGFVAVTQRESIMQFCRRTRGAGYAWGYRMAVGVSALFRLAALALANAARAIFRRRRDTVLVSKKWAAVVGWAFGFEHGPSGRGSR